jgi:hypothetical protein
VLQKVYEIPIAKKELASLQKEVKRLKVYIEMTECERYK